LKKRLQASLLDILIHTCPGICCVSLVPIYAYFQYFSSQLSILWFVYRSMVSLKTNATPQARYSQNLDSRLRLSSISRGLFLSLPLGNPLRLGNHRLRLLNSLLMELNLNRHSTGPYRHLVGQSQTSHNNLFLQLLVVCHWTHGFNSGSSAARTVPFSSSRESTAIGQPQAEASEQPANGKLRIVPVRTAIW
jgi:hypothetical protein